MAERLQYNPPSIYTERASEINYDDGTVNYLKQLTGSFLDTAQKAHRAELESNIAQAKQDGALAGSEAGMSFKPVKARGIVHRTYNDSAIDAATVDMSIKSQQAIQRIAIANPANPGAQQEAFKKWSDKHASKLPDAMIGPFRRTFDQLAASQLTIANREFAQLRQDEAVAKFSTYETNVRNSVEMFAPHVFQAGEVGTDANKALQTLRKNYVEMLVKNGPGAGYTVGGYDVPAAQGRSGAFSVKEIGDKIAEFDKTIVSAGVKGDFLKELEAGRGVGSYFNFVKGTTALTQVLEDGTISQQSVDDILDLEEKEKIATFMRTHISTLNSFEEAADRKSDRAKKNYNEAIMQNALASAFTTVEQPDGSKIVRGNPDALRTQYLAAVNDDSGLVDLDTIESLRSLMETVGTGDVEDPTVISKSRLAVINREITSVSQLPKDGLGDKGRGEMIDLVRKTNSGQHWSNSERYSTALQIGKAALAPEAATGFTLFGDPNSQSAADYAEFQERLMNEMISAERAGLLPVDINALPTGDEIDIDAKAREIIKQIKERRAAGEKDPEVDAINSRIKELNDILNSADTPEAEAKKAREDLKAAMDEKARLQQNSIGR